MVIQMCDTRQLAYKIVNSMDLNGNVQGAKMKATAMRKLGQHMFAIDSFEKLIAILDEENLGETAKRKLTLWWRLTDMKRDPFLDYKSFLNDFDLAVVELEAAEVVIDPTIKAGMLIRAIHLPDDEKKLVLSSINQKAENI